MLLGFLIVIWAVTTALSPRFLTPANLKDILIQAAPLGFVVIGQMIVIIVRGLDLSVASIMATVAVLSTSLIDVTPLIFAVGLMLGAADRGGQRVSGGLSACDTPSWQHWPR